MAASRSLLIVDDDEIARSILSAIFQDEFDIIEAENGRQAIALLTDSTRPLPAALLLDYMMPDMDGFAVLQYLADNDLSFQLPVFLITAETSNEIALRAFEKGVDDIINKPISVPAIVQKHVLNAIELYQIKNNLEKRVEKQIAIIREQTQTLKETHLSIIDMLSTVIEFRSGESGLHVSRIRRATKLILEYAAQHLPDVQFSQHEIEAISNAAAMHDIGKVSVSDTILNKPGRLTTEEFAEMKKHTIYGCSILQQIPFFGNDDLYKYCYEICRHHHERYDGGGYPDGLIGDDIPFYTQIVSLADVYDALVSERVYKKAFSHEKAKAMIMNGECGVFSDKLLSCFGEISNMLYHQLYELPPPVSIM